MIERIARRTFLKAGIASIAGVAGIGGAVYAARRGGLVPPDHGGVFGVGETLTYAAQRLLVPRQTLAREFDRSHISKVAEVNGYPPENDRYLRLLRRNFDDWRLTVDGAPAEILRTNRAMRGAVIAAGKHRLVYTYEPRSLQLVQSLSAGHRRFLETP